MRKIIRSLFMGAILAGGQTSVHAQRQPEEYAALINSIKGVNDTFPIQYKDIDGKSQMLNGYTCLAYDGELGMIDFKYYPLPGGDALITEISESELIPSDVNARLLANNYSLIIGAQGNIGEPTEVGIRKCEHIRMKGGGTNISISTEPLDGFPENDGVRARVEDVYRRALTQRCLPKL